jgi:hypothetical protein
MSGKCNPVHLPIIVEPRCGTSADNCNCDNVSKCDINCNIEQSYSTQGSYQNQCTNIVGNVPRLPIASLSNVRAPPDCPVDGAVKLNTICLPWCDFLRLFYANNSFRVSFSDVSTCASAFPGQTYEDTSSPCIRFYLAELVKKAWSDKCNIPVSNLPVRTAIILEKEAAGIKSLFCANNLVGLSLDEVIETLLTSGQIVPADTTSRADVIFTIEYLFYFKPLNIFVQVNFNYKTAIPCYKNSEPCDNWCPIYNNCNNCVNTPIPLQKVPDFSDMESMTGDNNSQADADTFMHHMRDLITKNDYDQSRTGVVTVESASSNNW